MNIEINSDLKTIKLKGSTKVADLTAFIKHYPIPDDWEIVPDVVLSHPDTAPGQPYYPDFNRILRPILFGSADTPQSDVDK